MHSQAEATPTPQGAPEREIVLPELPKSTACLWVTDNPKHCSLDRPAPNVVNAFPWPADSKSERDRLDWRERGFWQEPLFTAEQMNAHARTAILEDRARAAQPPTHAASPDVAKMVEEAKRLMLSYMRATLICADRATDANVKAVRVGEDAIHAAIDALGAAATQASSAVGAEREAEIPSRWPAAWRDLLLERHRQTTKEGWTARHDDQHSTGSMALAAACYACNAASWAQRDASIPQTRYADLAAPGFRWPWAMKWWKPKSQRQDLVRAGALILAEIERLDRAETKQ